jgi:hypothetical protein
LRGVKRQALRAPPIEIAPEERELVRELLDQLGLVPELGQELHAVLPKIIGMAGKGHARVRPSGSIELDIGHGFVGSSPAIRGFSCTSSDRVLSRRQARRRLLRPVM